MKLLFCVLSRGAAHLFSDKHEVERIHTTMIWRAILHFPQSLLHRFLARHADTSPTADFRLKSFMGRWYEQARLENPFEYGMDGVYSEYALIAPGQISVSNHGIAPGGKHSLARGQAFMPDSTVPGRLRVSFVPPYTWFSSPLHILYTDEGYREALVSGSGGHYLWLLTRERHPGSDSISHLLSEARRRGFDTSSLRYTHQP